MIKFIIKDVNHPSYDPVASNQVAGSCPTIEVTRQGKVMMLGDEELELFKIKTLSEALDRTTVTLIRWEKAGILPKPLFSVAGNPTKRWYSGVQILNLSHVLWNKHQGRKNHTLNLDRLTQDFREVFYLSSLAFRPLRSRQ